MLYIYIHIIYLLSGTIYLPKISTTKLHTVPVFCVPNHENFEIVQHFCKRAGKNDALSQADDGCPESRLKDQVTYTFYFYLLFVFFNIFLFCFVVSLFIVLVFFDFVFLFLLSSSDSSSSASYSSYIF